MSRPQPWTADRELTVDAAAAAVHHAVPGLAGARVRLLGSGWDFDAYEVDGRWVFRFPRRAGEQDRLRRDLAVLPWIAKRLDVPIPRYAWGELRAPSFPYIFSGYEKLPGVIAAAVDPVSVDLDALGHWLGRFFRALHALEPPATVVAGGGLDRARMDAGALRDRMRKHLEPFEREIGGAMARRARRFFEDDTLLPPPYAGPLRLVHDDLHAEHLLLDPAAGHAVVGLLDWSDVVLADPAREFGAIYSWGGEAMLHAMLRAYDSDDESLEVRARHFGLCTAFTDWDWWVNEGNALCVDRALAVLEEALPTA